MVQETQTMEQKKASFPDQESYSQTQFQNKSVEAGAEHIHYESLYYILFFPSCLRTPME